MSELVEGERELVLVSVVGQDKHEGLVEALIITPKGNMLQVLYGSDYDDLYRPLEECEELVKKFKEAGKIIRKEWMSQYQIDSANYERQMEQNFYDVRDGL